MSEKKPLRMTIYCRVATQSQFAADCQKEQLTRYAHALGYHSLVYYIDDGASGLTLDRPAFRKMEANIQAGEIGAVLTKDFTRLGRNVRQVLRWYDTIKRKGVAVLTMEQPGELLIHPTLESIYNAFATERRNKRK